MRVTGIPRLVVAETVWATEAFPAAAHPVALARLEAALGRAAEAVPGQAVRAVVPAWVVAVGEVVAAREVVAEADGGGN